MKTVFMGSDPIVLPMLRHLVKHRTAGIELNAVFTQPDRPSGRGMHLQANAVKEWAIEEGLPVHQPVKCSQADAAYLLGEQVDLVLVMAYGQFLPDCVLETPRLGVVNVHASLLPRLRGASPIHTAVAAGHNRTGVSLMRITSEMDAGPVAASEPVAILAADTTGDVQEKLAQACIPLVEKALPLLAAGELKFIEQEEATVTYCRIIEKEDAHLDFRQPAPVLANRVRAFQPWPGTSFPYRGLELRILAAEAEGRSSAGLQPGTVSLDSPGGLRIACGEGSLKLLRLQRPGGKALETAAFLRGFPMQEGEVLESREMQPLESTRPFPYRRRRKS